MEVWLAINLFISVINTLILLALAGAVAKLIKYLGGSPQQPPPVPDRVHEWPTFPSGDLVGPDHLDTRVLVGKADPYADGVNQRPPSRNWDGVTIPDEE